MKKQIFLFFGLWLIYHLPLMAHDSPYHLKPDHKILHNDYVADDPALHTRGRHEFSFMMDIFGMAGMKSEKYDVFFDVPTSDLKNAGYGGRLGIEGIMKKRFGFRLSTGYQRSFYSNIGIQQIKKNYITSDLLFMFHPKEALNRWDWYLMAGPNVLVSKSGVQGYLTTGGGARYFFNDQWSFKIEPAVVTDFSGVWGKMASGFNYHF